MHVEGVLDPVHLYFVLTSSSSTLSYARPFVIDFAFLDLNARVRSPPEKDHNRR